MSDPHKLPEPVSMPALDPNRILPYSAIRYVDGYPEDYVREYARTFAEQVRRETIEQCAKLYLEVCGPMVVGDDYDRAIRALASKEAN